MEWLVLTLALSLPRPVLVTGGESPVPQSGRLVAVEPETLRIAWNGEEDPTPVAREQITTVEFTDTEPVAQPTQETIRVELLGDSELWVTDAHLADRIVQVGTSQVGITSIPLANVRSLRFGPSSGEEDHAWQEIRSRTATADLLVVRKESGRLDYLECIIESMGSGRVRSRLDGQVVDVRLEKLAGLIFRVAATPTPGPVATVRLTNGTRWNLATWMPRGEQVRGSDMSGMSVTVPFDAVAAMEFRPIGVVYLSDIEPRSVTWHPFFRSSADEAMAPFFAPRRDRSFDDEPLALTDAESQQTVLFRKGLAIHSATRLVYRLGGDYARFSAIAGLAPSAAGLGHVELHVMCDGDTLWQGPIDDATGTNLSVDVKGRGEMTIDVQFGEGQDVGDRLHLANARLEK